MRPDARRPHYPVDHFLRSLASVQGAHAVGVVLSGTGSDGTLGLCEIKAAGGVTQDRYEAEALYRDVLIHVTIKFALQIDSLAEAIRQVITSAKPWEREVLDRDRHWWLVRVKPHITAAVRPSSRTTTSRRGCVKDTTTDRWCSWRAVSWISCRRATVRELVHIPGRTSR